MLNKPTGIIIVIILLIGLVFAVVLLQQATQTKQRASEITNVNTGSQISDAKNPDGTMGPLDSKGNYSNDLLDSELGSLTFSITDPAQGPALPTRIPTVTGFTQNPKVSSNSPSVKQGTQTVKSLILTVKKVEVHLARSKDKNNIWETINMPLPLSLDLVQLIDGGVVNLGLTKLAAGQYTEVRLYVQSAAATLEEGNVVNLEINGKDKVVRVVQNFKVEVNKNTNLIMDFDAMHSVVYTGNKYLLKPVVAKLIVNN